MSYLNYSKTLLLACLPQHAISRLFYFLTRIRSSWKNPFIRWFIRRYQVNMAEASISDPADYPDFNAFFTRALKPECRPVQLAQQALLSPVDGRISYWGTIEDGLLLQAKNHHYSLSALLANDADLTATFQNGQYMTLYLAPGDYHRIHMPALGLLKQMLHIPGRLYSVAPFTVNTLSGVFARNERVVCIFENELFGRFALILVGAINVAAIETVWHGLVTPPHGRNISYTDYTDKQEIILAQGAEMGRFNMGSTVILLFGNRMRWLQDIQLAQTVRYGQKIGQHQA